MNKLHFNWVINYMLVFTNVFISDRIRITLQALPHLSSSWLRTRKRGYARIASSLWSRRNGVLNLSVKFSIVKLVFECWRPFFDESMVITSIPVYAYGPLQRVPPCPSPGWGNKSVSYKVKTLKHQAQQSTLETLVKAKPHRKTSEGQPDLY